MNKTFITPRGPRLKNSLSELFAYKDLFITFAIRDFKVKYAQTFLGFFWAIFQQLVTIGLFSVIRYMWAPDDFNIGNIVEISGAIAIWNYFSFVLDHAGNSIIESGAMIKKIYFPRLVLPLSKGLVGLIDLAIGLIIVMIFAAFSDLVFSWRLVMLPVAVFFSLLTSLGCGIWVSALTIRYRDFKQIVPFVLRVGMIISPIFFTSAEITERIPAFKPFALLLHLNPMAGIIEAIKWTINPTHIWLNDWYISFGLSFVILISSILYFKRSERQIADFV